MSHGTVVARSRAEHPVWLTVTAVVLIFGSLAGRAWYERHSSTPVWLLIVLPVASLLGVVLADRGAGGKVLRFLLAALGGMTLLMWITAWFGMGPR